jgi:hypothetical protein
MVWSVLADLALGASAPHRTDQPTNLQPFIPCAVTLHLATTFDNYRNPCSASQVFVNRSMS